MTYTLNIDKCNRLVMKDMPDSVREKHLKGNSNAAAESIIHTGFIAQDVEKTAKDLGYNFDGVNKPTNPTDNYSLVYSQFVVPLVKAVQEQQKQIEEAKAENKLMKAEIIKLQGAIEILTPKINR